MVSYTMLMNNNPIQIQALSCYAQTEEAEIGK